MLKQINYFVIYTKEYICLHIIFISFRSYGFLDIQYEDIFHVDINQGKNLILQKITVPTLR